jgi:hypothetical protein
MVSKIMRAMCNVTARENHLTQCDMRCFELRVGCGLVNEGDIEGLCRRGMHPNHGDSRSCHACTAYHNRQVRVLTSVRACVYANHAQIHPVEFDPSLGDLGIVLDERIVGIRVPVHPPGSLADRVPARLKKVRVGTCSSLSGTRAHAATRVSVDASGSACMIAM